MFSAGLNPKNFSRILFTHRHDIPIIHIYFTRIILITSVRPAWIFMWNRLKLATVTFPFFVLLISNSFIVLVLNLEALQLFKLINFSLGLPVLYFGHNIIILLTYSLLPGRKILLSNRSVISTYLYRIIFEMIDGFFVIRLHQLRAFERYELFRFNGHFAVIWAIVVPRTQSGLLSRVITLNALSSTRNRSPFEFYI